MKLSVAIFFPHFRIKGLKAGRQDYGSYIYLFLLRLLFQIYGVILTYPFADATFLLFKIKTAFIYIGDKRDCLSKVDMDGFVLRYLLIILIRILDRAVFHADRAARAFVFPDISGLFGQRYLEVSCFPFYAFNFGIGENLYIGMPADLDQFRCEYSHRAVVGRKGLVKLGHMAADARRFLNQVNLKTGSGKIKGGLNAADPSADDHHISKIPVSAVFTKLLRLILFQY